MASVPPLNLSLFNIQAQFCVDSYENFEHLMRGKSFCNLLKKIQDLHKKLTANPALVTTKAFEADFHELPSCDKLSLFRDIFIGGMQSLLFQIYQTQSLLHPSSDTCITQTLQGKPTISPDLNKSAEDKLVESKVKIGMLLRKTFAMIVCNQAALNLYNEEATALYNTVNTLSAQNSPMHWTPVTYENPDIFRKS